MREPLSEADVRNIFEERIDRCRAAEQAGDVVRAMQLAHEMFSDAQIIEAANPTVFVRVCSACADVALGDNNLTAVERYTLAGIRAARPRLEEPQFVEGYAALVNTLALTYDGQDRSEIAAPMLEDAASRLKAAKVDAPKLSATIGYNTGLVWSHLGEYGKAVQGLDEVLGALNPDLPLGRHNPDLRFNALALYADMLFKTCAYDRIPPLWNRNIESCTPWNGSPLLWFSTHTTLGSALANDLEVARVAANRGLELVADDSQGNYCGALLHLGRGVALAANKSFGAARQELGLFLDGTRTVADEVAAGMRSLARGFVALALNPHAPKEVIQQFVQSIPDY